MKLLAAWLCLAIVACAAAKQAPKTPTAGAPPEQTMPESPHDEIERLSKDIAAQQSSAVPVAPTPMSAGASETCKSVCVIQDSICKNSRRICELADEIKDDWSAGKCTDATKACTDATKRCTDCS
jgi:hypothetical protein